MVYRRKTMNSELLNPHNRNNAHPNSEGKSVPFKETIMLHKAEKESQALTGGENVTTCASKQMGLWLWIHQDHFWALDHSPQLCTEHYIDSLYVYLIWQIKKQTALLRPWMWGGREGQISNYKWLNKSANYFLAWHLTRKWMKLLRSKTHTHKSLVSLTYYMGNSNLGVIGSAFHFFY